MGVQDWAGAGVSTRSWVEQRPPEASAAALAGAGVKKKEEGRRRKVEEGGGRWRKAEEGGGRWRKEGAGPHLDGCGQPRRARLQAGHPGRPTERRLGLGVQLVLRRGGFETGLRNGNPVGSFARVARALVGATTASPTPINPNQPQSTPSEPNPNQPQSCIPRSSASSPATHRSPPHLSPQAKPLQPTFSPPLAAPP
jgi:hypothetical protein